MIAASPTVPVHPTPLAAARSLADCRALLAAFGPRLYTASTPLLPGGNVGQHTRHILDHYAALFRIEEAGVIDYDSRARGTDIESSIDAALSEIDRLTTLLVRVDEARAAAPVTVRVMIDATGARALHDSTLGREIAFASHHAVHHHAMLAAIAREHGLPVPDAAGIAPSTRHHQEHAAAG